jgi:hypothetical protein
VLVVGASWLLRHELQNLHRPPKKNLQRGMVVGLLWTVKVLQVVKKEQNSEVSTLGSREDVCATMEFAPPSIEAAVETKGNQTSLALGTP